MSTASLQSPTASQPLNSPHLPNTPPFGLDALSLSESRDFMTALQPDEHTLEQVQQLLGEWHRRPDSTASLERLRAILDEVRKLPRGAARVLRMNTIVRTLGQRALLADLLDMMRGAAQKPGTREYELVSVSLKSSKHSVYGWAGQTKILRSSSRLEDGTVPAEPGVQQLLGVTPASAWSMSLHIWQPNAGAQGFRAGRELSRGTISEPPHSHPFDFVSMLSVGSMRQSTYEALLPGAQSRDACDRYASVPLTHVEGVWPPHHFLAESCLRTLEQRVLLGEGDSYFLPCHAVHDVEVDPVEASRRPAISLFLRTESMVMPHVYMAPEMAAFHQENPNLERSGCMMDEEDWHEKLGRVVDYLRGTRPTLQLHDVVRMEAPYAFFHV